ncbi:hypothetical protein [Pseudomonas sp. Pseu.R1]|uniref:hypothetical protein n=1 Tax=Pseudomonas sp. Pseu.R1 TaxID=3379818 RepID=UPI003B9546D4
MNWVKLVLLKMATDIVAKHGNAKKVLDNLEKVTDYIDSNIRHPVNSYLIECICALLFNLAEQKYGDSSVEHDGICMRPAFVRQPRSFVGATLATEDHPKIKYIICLGSYIRTWEQLFYELAHETLHLLGPTDTYKHPVACIEEGVAVKFAEDFYDSYITPVAGLKSHNTPLNAPSSVYHKAHKITNKIPDTVLKAIRKEFFNFKDVQKEGLHRLANEFITDNEATYLSSRFDYHAY